MLRILNVLLFSILVSCTFISNVFAADVGGASFDQVQQAAINGDPDAEYALGYMYYYGKGVTRDEQAAAMWIQKAAAQGQPQAMKAIKLLGLTVPPDSGATATTNPVDNNASAATVAGITQTSATSPVRKKAAKSTAMPYASKMPTMGQNQNSSSADEKRLLSTPPDYFTIQLLGAYSKDDILNFIRMHNIAAKSFYYKTSYQGRPWYVLVYGLYKSDAAATTAVKQLPDSVQRLNPWVKSIETVQHGIRSGVE